MNNELQKTRRIPTAVAVGVISILTLAWLGFHFLAMGVSCDYHPNPCNASIARRYQWVYWIFFGVNILAVGYFVSVKGMSFVKATGLGMLALVVLSVIHFVGMGSDDHDVAYFIDDQEYAIPWRYNPFNGSDTPGGAYFVIETTYPDFGPRYGADRDAVPTVLRISMNKAETRGVSESSHYVDLDDCSDTTVCTEFVSVYFKANGYTFIFSTSGRPLSFASEEEAEAFRASVVGLFEGFRAGD